MGLHEDILLFRARLNAAIDDAMQTDVAEAAKQRLVDTAQELVYDAYEPAFRDRWYDDGGLLDTTENVMETHYNPADLELEIIDNPPWHDGDDESTAGIPLTEAVEKGVLMGGAGPRPFVAEAEHRFAASGEFEEALTAGLRRNGMI